MTEPYRVLHLITRFLDGGAEKSVEDILSALRAAPEEYDLRVGVGAEHDPARLDALRETGTDVAVFRTIRHYNPVTALPAVLCVARYLQSEQIDILHTHSTEAGVIGRWASVIADVPVTVHSVHGDPIASDRNPLLNAILYFFERVSAPLSDRIVTNSRRVRDTYLERGFGYPDQYEVIYDGLDLDAYRAPDRWDDLPPADEPVSLLFVGRLTDGKGLFDLVEAVDQVAESHSIELDIAGDGENREELQDAVKRRGLEDSVSFLGYCDDVPSLLATADVFVLPSYREGMPRVITEARAAGLPIVSTAVAGIPEQVSHGETGFLVEPGDVSELSARIEQLVASPSRRREMSERTTADLNRFDIERMRQSYRSLYCDLLDSVS
ncbi:glycosyltransferase family 4 protein [Haloarcula argentinensis]|uniref:Glycosyl transferase family 1 n=1 Tax=Haloarcula argentinensis TaxID=43776 RepID=A0A830FFL9_HALAR|nr:glycosyltransferase family 4 protein [Haloarcula argentinensis]EMA18470.1 group 1 glycosyl transferase [Haloarcula argentinensis DSM 12282]MDS0253969.1 glycosyltransferase family 4 protein [Haloarcula argentinensis]GGM45159.1 glycosyl transferase family 1 [Haloarcula argentinensis]